MDFVFTMHLRGRLDRRGIERWMIDAVLSAPAWTPSTSRNTRYDALIDGRRLAVIVAEEHQPVVIVTAFWTRPDGSPEV